MMPMRCARLFCVAALVCAMFGFGGITEQAAGFAALLAPVFAGLGLAILRFDPGDERWASGL